MSAPLAAKLATLAFLIVLVLATCVMVGVPREPLGMVKATVLVLTEIVLICAVSTYWELPL